MLRRDGSSLPWFGKGEILTQVQRISKKVILAAGLRPELTFTSFGRHDGTTEASTSGLTQLMQKGQWSSTAAMAHYLHDDDEAKAGRTNEAYQAACKTSEASDRKVNICQNGNTRLVRMKDS